MPPSPVTPPQHPGSPHSRGGQTNMSRGLSPSLIPTQHLGPMDPKPVYPPEPSRGTRGVPSPVGGACHTFPPLI